MRIYVECGSCGYYHEKGYEGECRDDKMRFTLEEIIADIDGGAPDVTIVTLDDQGADEEGKEYTYSVAEMCFLDSNGDTVYCNAWGCEAPASELVGENHLPLCGVCADIWNLGYEAGLEAAKKGIEREEGGI